jgi:hypothetical protein
VLNFEIRSATGRVPMAVTLRQKSSRPTSFLRLAYSAPAPQELSSSGIRRYTRPAAKSLPFVKLRPNDQPLWQPESFWNVEPTGKREYDFKLGRKYARLAIAAMKADGDSHLISLIIQDIVKDTVARMGKKGRGARNATVLGFLAEISEVAATAGSRLAPVAEPGFPR